MKATGLENERGLAEDRVTSGLVALKPRRVGGAHPEVRGPRPAGGRVYIETYGCQMNINDTELMEGLLAGEGFVRVSRPGDADVILINTCVIRERAETRVRGRIGHLQRYRKRRPGLVLGVTGCMAQRLGQELIEKTDGVDLVAGPDAYRGLPTLIASIQRNAIERGQALLAMDGSESYEDVPTVRQRGTSAWITVQRGCNHRCTFCVVPYVRGPEKNRTPGAVLAEARQAAEDGFSEVVLLGQTVNSYRSGDCDFAALLRRVSRVDGIRRVRFTSPHPNDVTSELLQVMATEPAVCRQLHLPMQSGSDRVLKRMVRRYTAEAFLEKAEAARRTVPGIALSTDVITGFPGESEADFDATLDLMRQIRFEDAYLYRYSLRAETPAARLPAADRLPDSVAAERLELLIGVHRGIQREINESEVGSAREVLVERPARSEGDILGRTEQNKVVAFPGEPERIGSYANVLLTETTGATFRGVRR